MATKLGLIRKYLTRRPTIDRTTLHILIMRKFPTMSRTELNIHVGHARKELAKDDIIVPLLKRGPRPKVTAS